MRKNKYPSFPQNFLWAGAQAASQADGAFDEGSKKANSSDVQPFLRGLSNDEIQKIEREGMTLAELKKNVKSTRRYFPKRHGIDFYHSYESDLELLAEAGLKAFRTSIDWSRVFPNGDDKVPNELALQHYDKMIDKIISLGMEPIITMLHYETPVNITLKYGGWNNRKVIDMFERYGKVLLDRFGKKVKYWILVNQINLIQIEPFLSLGICSDQYENVDLALYQGVHYQMVACAKIQKYAKSLNNPNLYIGTMVADGTVYPNTCAPEDVSLAMQRNRMQYFFTDVQFRGEYPRYAKRFFEDNGIRLEITDEDKSLLKGNTLDYFAMSYYYSATVKAGKDQVMAKKTTPNPYLKANPWGWTIDPLGLYNSISQYWDRYRKPIIIAENGFGMYDKIEDDGKIHDNYRIDYLSAHIEQVGHAIADGANVISYCMWGPIDIVSCSSQQMSKRYGIVYVDIDDEGHGSKKRYKKDSYTWYQKLITSNGKFI